jgi:hypothetical protein
MRDRLIQTRQVAIVWLFMVFNTANAAVVALSDNGKVLNNPDMGWTIYYYANSLKYYAKEIDKLADEQLFSFPGLSLAMFRLSWSHLEPTEGVFKWEVIDTPAKRFTSNGVKIAIRISNSENVADQPYATPKWVFDAGAAAIRFRPGYPGTLDMEHGANREPVFNDPVFLSKLENFIKALAERYDGNPDVAYVDIGSFGVYGEGHTYSSTKTPYDESTIKTHIDIYKKYFKKTQLIANHNFADHTQDGKRNMRIIEYSASQGLGLRDDSILIDKGHRAFYDSEMAKLFYKQAPVILETGEYSSRVRKGYWNPAKVVEAVKAYHASYIGAYWDPMGYLAENSDLISEVNKILGYRYVFSKVSYPDTSKRKNEILVSYSLKNVGVSKCHRKGWVKFSIHAGDGKMKANAVDKSTNICDVFDQQHRGGHSLENTIRINLPVNLPSANYQLYAAIVDEEGHPWLELPHDAMLRLS